MITTARDQNLTDAVKDFDARVRALPWRIGFDETSDDEFRVNSFLATFPYVIGDLPHHRNVNIQPVDTSRAVVPSHGAVVRICRSPRATSRLCIGDGWVAAIRQNDDGYVHVSLSTRDDSTADAVTNELRQFLRPPDDDPTHVDVAFTHLGTTGTNWTNRRVIAPAWPSIERNYAPSVRDEMRALLGREIDESVAGRLVLLHGPPGTGKTTLIRTMAQTWRSWCSTTIVVDPDRLFRESGYLFEVVLDEDDDNAERWRLLVLEDCDELLRADAKERTGQALSRLLNLADGVIGQGLRLLICLTTNEDVGRLHPALLRPGRCLANVEVRGFTRAEAAAWLKGTGRRAPADGATLAELYALLRGDAIAPAAERRVVGLYL